MSKNIGVGIIGTGIGLRQVAPGFLRTGKADIVAVSGSSIERTKEYCKDIDVDSITDDFKALCDSDTVDLICVTTPNKFHYEQMSYALSTDKHVFLEKPVGMTEQETKELSELVGNKNRLIVVGHQLRFNPYIARMKEIIESGVLGRIYYLSIAQYVSSWNDLDRSWSWSFDVENYGGRRLALGVHSVDLARFLLSDEATSVSCVLDPVHRFRTPGGSLAKESLVSDFMSAQLTFPGSTVNLETSASARTNEIFDVVVRGENGELTFDLTNKLLSLHTDSDPIALLSQADNDYNSLNGPSIFWDSFTYYASKIVDTLENGQTTLANASTMDDAIENMKVLDACLKSNKEGTRELFTEWTDNTSY